MVSPTGLVIPAVEPTETSEGAVREPWETRMARDRPSVPPILALLGDRDVQCSKRDLERTLAATGATVQELMMVGKESGYPSHVGHFDIVLGKSSTTKLVFQRIIDWVDSHDTSP